MLGLDSVKIKSYSADSDQPDRQLMPKPLADRIAELQAKKEKLAGRLSRLQSSAKSEARKRETRRKIVIGAAVLAQIEHDKGFALLLRDALNKSVSRDQDREIIADLLASPVR